MSVVERMGLVVSRSVCVCVLCCVVCVQFWCNRINCTVLKVQMKVTLWRLGSCQ